ncbi:acyltransferase family protein [Fictibacillus fluitans]|uniref:Acyltransferase n=1 Tax=Fictibacillus fluitans TaxID=3058422 RepID=A0ABT8I1X9_9BACL|nr:acyltransferase [Fictibacillus sp. NE201]MDN4526715.1 acyltransferase [Fictibacillus sp. NE201]
MGEFTKNEMKVLQGTAILFMLLLHLFCRKDVNGLYDAYPLVNNVPLIYYLGLFGDACVPIFCFCSGYGLFMSKKENNSIKTSMKKNLKRITKLLINFWIIMFLFIVIGIISGKTEFMSGGFTQFLGNFFLVSNSYNGAWWFLQTYILLVFLAPPIFRLVNRYPNKIILFISLIIYFFTYVQRIKQIFIFGNPFIDGVMNSIVLLGTSQFAFVLGAIFAKEQIYSNLKSKVYKVPMKNLLCLLGILTLGFIHALIESMFIAPFTALGFICLFSLLNKSKSVERFFAFMGNHSTNIWLTHMFFYMSIFPVLTFAPRYPVFIFFWLLILCLTSSFVINLIFHPVLKFVMRENDSKREEILIVPTQAKNQ